MGGCGAGGERWGEFTCTVAHHHGTAARQAQRARSLAVGGPLAPPDGLDKATVLCH